RGSEQSRLSARDSPGGDEGGNDEAVKLNVHRVEGPTPEAGPEGASFSRGQMGDPPEGAALDYNGVSDHLVWVFGRDLSDRTLFRPSAASRSAPTPGYFPRRRIRALASLRGASSSYGKP